MKTHLPAPGTVCMLTTYGPDGTLHSRPVSLWPGDGPNDLVVLTDADAAKVDEIDDRPQVGLGGPWSGGWWSAEGTAIRDPDAVPGALRRAGIPAHRQMTVIRITVSRARSWQVTGRGPWDNSYSEHTFANADE